MQLDLTGLRCPIPIVRLAQNIDKLEPGDEILVTSTDPAFPMDVAAWCRQTGHELLEIHEQPPYQARIRHSS